MARIVCSSTVYVWYMSCCVCATTRPKSGTKRPNTPASLRRRKRRLGIVARGQHRHEQAIGLGIVAQPVDQPDVLRDQPQASRDGCRGRSPARHGTGAGSPPDPSRTIVGRRRASRSPSSRKPSSWRGRSVCHSAASLRLAPMAVLERGDEDARQVADRLGMKIVVLHEALDAAAARRGPGSPGACAISRWRSNDRRSSARPVR